MHISHYFFCFFVLLCTACQSSKMATTPITNKYPGKVVASTHVSDAIETPLHTTNPLSNPNEQHNNYLTKPVPNSPNPILVKNTTSNNQLFRQVNQPLPTTSFDPQQAIYVVPNNAEDGNDIYLKGIVVDSTTLNPIPYATLELIDSTTQQNMLLETAKDGAFQFKLLPNTNYYLILSYNSVPLAEKSISTIDMREAKTIHTFFPVQIHPHDILAKERQIALTPNDPLTKPMSDIEDVEGEKIKNTKDSYGDPYDDSVLTFKIQLGSFKRSMNPNNFFSKLNEKDIDVERAPNGFNRYVTGNFKIYKEANHYRQELIKKGYTQAFIAAYLNGYRLEMPAEKVVEIYYQEHQQNGTVPKSRD